MGTGRDKSEFFAKKLREYRKLRRECQCMFWGRFGVSQSRGSRFEIGAEIPPPIEILLRLYLNGRISDCDLQSAKSTKL